MDEYARSRREMAVWPIAGLKRMAASDTCRALKFYDLSTDIDGGIHDHIQEEDYNADFSGTEPQEEDSLDPGDTLNPYDAVNPVVPEEDHQMPMLDEEDYKDPRVDIDYKDYYEEGIRLCRRVLAGHGGECQPPFALFYVTLLRRFA